MEEGGSDDVILDPPDSFLLCISENWDKLKKQLTVGVVVSQIRTMHSGNVMIRLETL